MLIDIAFRGDRKNRILEVYIDGEENVSIDQCAEISREIFDTIDQDPGIKTDYRLDVSSPGVNRPLKYLRQFPKHIDRSFEIKYETDSGEVKKTKGKLRRIENDDLVFEVNGKELLINYNKIKEAKVLISFS